VVRVSDGDGAPGNDGSQFDRLPATAEERTVGGRATREEVLDWWAERFGIPPETFDAHTFWEKGKGNIWVFAADLPSPQEREGVGMTVLRTRQEHWKPTTTAVRKWGHLARKNVIELSPGQATAFAAGHDQDLPEWDGDWGYLIATHDLAGGQVPIGVGLYLYDELRSVVPKGYQEELSDLGE
jgi:NOL1/NOP2/fmu family ribosome biogenesis protein